MMPHRHKTRTHKGASHYLVSLNRNGETQSIEKTAADPNGLIYRYGICEYAGTYLYALEDSLGLCALEPAFRDPESALAAAKKCAAELAQGSQSVIVRDDIWASLLMESYRQHSLDATRLHLYATVFELAVWKALAALPSGCKASYGELARLAGQKPSAARAVGSVLAKNRIALFLPCHRIIPAKGGIGAFRWGANYKEKLLQMEGAATTKNSFAGAGSGTA